MIDTIKKVIIIIHMFPSFFILISVFSLFVLTGINGMLILPMIFNFKIIPEIERKVGQKLEYRSSWRRIPFWKFTCRYLDVSAYIWYKYLTKKTGINFAKMITRNFALRKVNYDINRASRFEIIMSFIATLNGWLSIISAILLFLITHHYINL